MSTKAISEAISANKEVGKSASPINFDGGFKEILSTARLGFSQENKASNDHKIIKPQPESSQKLLENANSAKHNANKKPESSLKPKQAEKSNPIAANENKDAVKAEVEADSEVEMEASELQVPVIEGGIVLENVVEDAANQELLPQATEIVEETSDLLLNQNSEVEISENENSAGKGLLNNEQIIVDSKELEIELKGEAPVIETSKLSQNITLASEISGVKEEIAVSVVIKDSDSTEIDQNLNLDNSANIRANVVVPDATGHNEVKPVIINENNQDGKIEFTDANIVKAPTTSADKAIANVATEENINPSAIVAEESNHISEKSLQAPLLVSQEKKPSQILENNKSNLELEAQIAVKNLEMKAEVSNRADQGPGQFEQEPYEAVGEFSEFGGILAHEDNKLSMSFKAVADKHLENIPYRADQIIMAVKAANAHGKKEISLSMYPETLGGVDVKLEFNKGQIVSIKIFAEKPETLKLLQEDVNSLTRALSEVVKADNASLSFNLKDGQNGNNYQAPEDPQIKLPATDSDGTIVKKYQINLSPIQNDGVDIRV